MGELLLITNIEDDIIFKKEFDIMNDKEYCSLFMLGYSSLDIIEEIRFSTVKTFFKSLDTQSKWDVSVYFLPSGFKLIYINEDSEEKRVYDFMSKVHILLRKIIMAPMFDYKDVIENICFDDTISKAYAEIVKK
ncbi:TRAPP subunit [Hamiltosporidium tvaerminnensis]|nr:TRAPP subunit [Hamiltosporidium tvaerminnensis]